MDWQIRCVPYFIYNVLDFLQEYLYVRPFLNSATIEDAGNTSFY